MAQKNAFDKFREATFEKPSNPIRDAINPLENDHTIRYVVKKNPNKELVSFSIDKQHKHLLGSLKFSTGRSYTELYAEAVEDLLRKYGKI